jgi:hypothetical protein
MWLHAPVAGQPLPEARAHTHLQSMAMRCIAMQASPASSTSWMYCFWASSVTTDTTKHARCAASSRPTTAAVCVWKRVVFWCAAPAGVGVCAWRVECVRQRARLAQPARPRLAPLARTAAHLLRDLAVEHARELAQPPAALEVGHVAAALAARLLRRGVVVGCGGMRGARRTRAGVARRVWRSVCASAR